MKQFSGSRRTLTTGLAAVLALVLIAGCSGDSSVVSPEAAAVKSGQASDQAALRDAPDGFEDIILVLRGISARRASDDEFDGFYGDEFDPVAYHLADLSNGIGELLNGLDLPAGHYDQIRLLLADGNRIVIGGEEFDLFVPSGQTSGIKLDYEFDLVEGGSFTATVALDVSGSIRRTGRDRYLLQPVLVVEETEPTAGSILGVAYPAEAEAIVWTVTAAADTVTTAADPVTGAFLLDGLPAGSYGVHFDATVEGPWMSITLVGVPVQDGEATDLGTVNLLVPN